VLNSYHSPATLILIKNNVNVTSCRADEYCDTDAHCNSQHKKTHACPCVGSETAALVRFCKIKHVSESDILGPIDYFSDIENLISLERAMLADYSLRNKKKIFPFFMSISLL